jgi:hypothetical protein
VKPKERCGICRKPIWDYDYVTIRDSYIDANIHVHSCCKRSQELTTIEAEANRKLFDEYFGKEKNS